MIEFPLDETSGVATYPQQVHQALRMGMLEVLGTFVGRVPSGTDPAGDEMPARRQHLGVAP